MSRSRDQTMEKGAQRTPPSWRKVVRKTTRSSSRVVLEQVPGYHRRGTRGVGATPRPTDVPKTRSLHTHPLCWILPPRWCPALFYVPGNKNCVRRFQRERPAIIIVSTGDRSSKPEHIGRPARQSCCPAA